MTRTIAFSTIAREMVAAPWWVNIMLGLLILGWAIVFARLGRMFTAIATALAGCVVLGGYLAR
jgi:hypothetical protein